MLFSVKTIDFVFHMLAHATSEWNLFSANSLTDTKVQFQPE